MALRRSRRHTRDLLPVQAVGCPYHVSQPLLGLQDVKPRIPLLADIQLQKQPEATPSKHNLEDAIAHLVNVDARFSILASQYYARPWSPEELQRPQNHFRNIVLSVLSQQVSGAAARAISTRFIALFAPAEVNITTLKNEIDPEVIDNLKMEAAPLPDAMSEELYFPLPHVIAEAEVLFMKSAGLSLRKAEYVKGIARAFADGFLSDSFFSTASDEAIMQRLVSIRGLGLWSAEMFMMFSLKRWDILSTGDIGIQRGMSYWLGRDPKDKSKHHKGKCKYLTEAEMYEAARNWLV